MRYEKLSTFVNKALVLCEQIKLEEKIHLNSDETTKHQQKIYGLAINGLCTLWIKHQMALLQP